MLAGWYVEKPSQEYNSSITNDACPPKKKNTYVPKSVWKQYVNNQTSTPSNNYSRFTA